MYVCVEWERIEDGWAAHSDAEVRIIGETSSGLDQNLSSYILSQTPMQMYE